MIIQKENQLLCKKSFKNAIISWSGHGESAEILIQNGADVNVVSTTGRTVLMEAAESGKE